jgi:hypothetical protein
MATLPVRKEGLITRRTARRPGVRQQNVLSPSRITIKLDRLIVLSKSSLLGWFLHVSLIVIIKGRSPMEVSLIVIINQV